MPRETAGVFSSNNASAAQLSLIGQHPGAPTNNMAAIPQAPPTQYPSTSMWAQPLQFSAMSDNEIIETVLRAGNEFDLALPDIPMDDTTGLIWSDWMNAPEFGF